MSLHPDSNQFHVRRADWDRDREALREIRRRVFIEEQAVSKNLEWDGNDGQAIHLLALDASNRPIGTARLIATGQIGRMAVLSDWRNRGVGGALLRAMLDIANNSGHRTPFLNAQVSALPFYLRMGFEPVGEQFEEAGITHRRMTLSTERHESERSE